MRYKYYFQIILLSLLIAGCSNSGVSDRKGKSHADWEHQAAKEINPLMLLSSVINNVLAGVRALLEQGVEVNTLDVDKWSALMYASYEGYVDIMESLISYGADPMIKDVDGDNAMVFARNNDHWEVADFLETQMH